MTAFFYTTIHLEKQQLLFFIDNLYKLEVNVFPQQSQMSQAFTILDKINV